MASRTTASVVLGALAAAVGWAAWAAWAMLGPHEASESALPETAATVATPAPAAPVRAQRPVEQASTAATSIARSLPAAPPRAPPPLRDGLVMEHGMPMAAHALAGDADAQALAPPVVTLPLGVRPEDAVVNRAGTVALNHSADTGVDAASANALRPTIVTRAP